MNSSPSSAMQNEGYPGFGFHPSEELLLDYYLVGKIRGEDKEDWPIGDINLSAFEPRDLPCYSKNISNKEWFFFNRREYMNGGKKGYRRKAKNGYWKMTGRPRKIKGIGQRRIFVFYKNGKRGLKAVSTEWIMHEYELIPNFKNPNAGDFVLIRVEKQVKKKTKKSKPRSERDSTNEFENSDQHEMTGNELVMMKLLLSENQYKETISFMNFEHQNKETSFDMSTYGRGQLNCLMTFDCVNQSSAVEIGESEWSPSTTSLLLSKFQNLSVQQDVLDWPVNSFVYGDQTSIEIQNPSNVQGDMPIFDEGDWWNLMELDVEDNEAAAVMKN